MWHWQRRVVHRKYIFLRNVLYASTLFHLIALFMLFFVYQGDNFVTHISMVPADAKIVVLPFQKSVGHIVVPQAVAPALGLSPSGRGQQHQDSKPRTRTFLSSRNSSTRSSRRKKKSVKPSNRHKKVQQPLLPQQSLAQQPLPQSVPQQEQHENQRAEVQEQVVPAATVPGVDVVAETQDTVIYIGQDDRAMLELSAAVRDELIRVWRPPMLGGKGCVVRILIDWQGVIRDIIMEQSSNILAFDASVRYAVQVMQFPKGAWGKELVIPFNA